MVWNIFVTTVVDLIALIAGITKWLGLIKNLPYVGVCLSVGEMCSKAALRLDCGRRFGLEYTESHGVRCLQAHRRDQIVK